MVFQRSLAGLAFFSSCLCWVGGRAQTVTLAPTTLSGGNVGSQLYQLVTAGGGTAPYVYSLTSGTLPSPLTLTPGGILSGTPTTSGTSSITVTGCDSSASVLCGSVTYSVSIGTAKVQSGTIAWSPAGPEVTYSGFPIGAAVLDATTTNSGAVSYTYQTQPNGPASPTLGQSVAANAMTVLASGSYVLTATNSTDGSNATVHFTVLPQHEWIINAGGNVTGLDAAANSFALNVAGGGLGAAIDRSGAVWSGNASGTSLTTFSSSGIMTQSGVSGGGLSAPAGIAIDGAGSVWVANGNASVSQFTNAGVALSPAGGFTGGSLSAPTGIAVDQAGNVWVSNGGNNSITELIGAGTPVAPVTAAVTNATVGEKP